MSAVQAIEFQNGFFAPYRDARYGFWRSFAYYFTSFNFWRDRLEHEAEPNR